ncbi:MAG TPA: YihY/virulence factor BrkB family protein [Solirubrobacteraceae bacterium]
MNFRARLEAFDRYQQGHRWLAVPFAVIRKFSNDQAGSLAALIAYYGFFSLFPLLLVFVTVLGYVLHGDPSAQKSIKSGVLGQFPIIGTDIQGHIQALHGKASTLLVGIAGSLWGGLGVTNATQNAFNRVWAVPLKERPNFIQSRVRGLGVLVLLGVLFMVSSLASGLVTGGLGGPLALVGGIAVSLLLNVLLFLAAFRLLTSAQVETRCLMQGVLVASVLWEILQIVGGIYVGHVLRHADATYGVFGIVIGLLSWLYLGAQATLYAAEINVVHARRLWPRSLLHDPPTIGDEETLTALAKVEERIEGEHIDVSFGAPPEDA